MRQDTELIEANLGFAERRFRRHLDDQAVWGNASSLANMQQLIQLRWIAVIGQVVTIVVAQYSLGLHLPLELMLAVLMCLVAFNVASLLGLRAGREVGNNALFVALLVDVGTLTAQLYLSGGTSNPFVSLYLLQVILGAVLLKAWSTWTIVAITGICFAGLALFSRPLNLPVDIDRGLASLYVQGALLCFALNAALLVVFITRINRNLRARDARLADLRHQATEEEHIVRMGLLTSGAAHELGTPLSTVSVILGDWRRMQPFSTDAELRQELEEMETQIQRCKAIVGDILLSAGGARGESPVVTTLRTFLEDLVTEWRATRPLSGLRVDLRIGDDLPIVSDSALKQMICNVLDNALEVSPEAIFFEVTRDRRSLELSVTDEGPGFAPAMLADFGKPYQSSKSKPGSGLGLFLVTNVARTLGGSVRAINRVQGGAKVTLSLPLEAITLEGIQT